MYDLKELDTCIFSDHVMCDCAECSHCEYYYENIKKIQNSTQMENEQLSMIEGLKYGKKTKHNRR